MNPVEFCRGAWGSVIFAVDANGKCPSGDFFEELDKSDRNKMGAMFRYFSEQGRISNREKFKKITDSIFEFKCHQIRMLCFIENAAIVITHGCRKKKDNLSQTEIERAERIRKEYRERFGR